jgi:hypothetical protein
MHKPLLTAFAATLTLTGCATSSIDIQVPQSEIANFATCVDKPSTSYKRPPPSAGPVRLFGDISTLDIQTEIDAAGGRFITNEELGAAANRSQSAFTGWAESFASAYGTTAPELTAAAAEADQIWDHPVQQHFMTAFNQLTTKGNGRAAQAGTLKSADFVDYLKRVRSVSVGDGWTAFTLKHAKEFRALKSSGADSKLTILAAQKVGVGAFISTYLKYYFRNGQFTQLTWEAGNPLDLIKKLGGLSSPSDQKTLQDILDELKRVDPNAADKINTILQKQLSGSIGKVGTTGLTTRGGDSLIMPAITIDANASNSKIVTVTKVDVNGILEDVVRVTFEGFFDALNQIPATTKSTGVTELPANVALADFAKISPVYPGHTVVMSNDGFGNVDSIGGQVHAMTASATASLIRGASFLALNNESLANVLTMMAATTARKATERVVWCYYAVIPPAAITGPQSALPVPRGTQTVTLTLKR